MGTDPNRPDVLPSLRGRIASTLITAAAAGVLLLTAGFGFGILGSAIFPATGTLDVTLIQQMEDAGASETALGAAAVASRIPQWYSMLTLVIAGLIVTAATARLGRGTPGDGVMGLAQLDANGKPAPRWRGILRAALPIALVVATGLAGYAWIGVLIALAGSAVAIFRPDRRGAWELASGIVLRGEGRPEGEWERNLEQRRAAARARAERGDVSRAVRRRMQNNNQATSNPHTDETQTPS